MSTTGWLRSSLVLTVKFVLVCIHPHYSTNHPRTCWFWKFGSENYEDQCYSVRNALQSCFFEYRATRHVGRWLC